MRVATSGKFGDGLIDIQEAWAFDDLMQAHEVLDMFEAAEMEAERRMEASRAAASKRRGGSL